MHLACTVGVKEIYRLLKLCSSYYRVIYKEELFILDKLVIAFEYFKSIYSELSIEQAFIPILLRRAKAIR